MADGVLQKIYQNGMEYETKLVNIPVGRKIKVANIHYNSQPGEGFDRKIFVDAFSFIRKYPKITVSYLWKGKELEWQLHPLNDFFVENKKIPDNPENSDTVFLDIRGKRISIRFMFTVPGGNYFLPDQDSPIYIARGGDKALYTLILQGFTSLFRKVALAC